MSTLATAPLGEASDGEDDEEYTAVPTIDCDDLIHTSAHPFCPDMSCPCHEDQNSIRETNEYYQNGLLSREDVERRYQGKVNWW